jgi:hypothetical protein
MNSNLSVSNLTDEELIKNVLFNYPAYYIMYPGGAGGELLCNLISTYSNKFRNYNSIEIWVTDSNRTIITLPTFFQILSLCRLQYNHINELSSIDDLVSSIKNQHICLGHNLKEKIDEAINFLNENENPPLFKSHISTNMYFTNNNTYLIWPDNQKWHTYKEILLFLKVLNSKYYAPTEARKIKFFEYERRANVNNVPLFNLYSSALEWVIKNDISELYEIQLSMVELMLSDHTLTFKQIFNTDPTNLFKKYKDKINDFQSQSYFIYSKLNDKVKTVIQYSKIFEKGYLEKIFDIVSDQFHEKLIEWHQRNLELMSKNGFDYTEYKL